MSKNAEIICGRQAVLTPEDEQRIREAKNAYAREYRRKHPEKNRQYVQRYWARKLGITERNDKQT